MGSERRCRSWRKLPFSPRRVCCLEAGHGGEHVAGMGDRWGEPEPVSKVLDLMAALKSALAPKAAPDA